MYEDALRCKTVSGLIRGPDGIQEHTCYQK